MDNALPLLRIPSASRFREVVLPREHGSWSLALEPLAFGLIAAPSAAGAWLAVAVIAAFFARRPLRALVRETRAARRHDAAMAVATCSAVAVAAFVAAMLVGGLTWVKWLIPSAIAGAVFVSFDLRNGGREELAEIAGSAAFALLPAAFAVVAGFAPLAALALGAVMCGRAIPTVLSVRATLRGAKTGKRTPAPALLSATAALALGVLLARSGLAPIAAVIALAALALRTAILLSLRTAPRARIVGMFEAGLGVLFVTCVGFNWA